MNTWKYVLFYLSVFLVTLILSIDFSYDFLEAGIVGVLIIALALFSVLLMVFAKKILKIHGAITLVVLVVTVIFSNTITKLQSNNTKRHATSLIDELENYNDVNGQYPSVIVDLKNIDNTLSYTKMGILRKTKFKYWPKDNEYNLSFQLPGWVNYSYHSDRKIWVIHD